MRGPLREFLSIFLQYVLAPHSKMKFESHLGGQLWDWRPSMNTSPILLDLNLKLALNNLGGLSANASKPTRSLHSV